MKIALVRGPSLNKWEMQNYEPLGKSQNLLAIGSYKGVYDTSSIMIPIKKLVCLGDIFYNFPFGIKFLYKFFGDPQYLIGFEKNLKGYDIVLCAELGSFYTYQAIKAKKKGLIKKVAVTVWETIPNLSYENEIRKIHKNQVIKHADIFFPVTERAKQVLIKEGVNPNKIKVVPMGVNLNIFKPYSNISKLKREYKINKNKKIILFVGRLVQEKGIYILLEALNLIKNRNDWEAIFIGEGPEEINLRKEIKKNNLNEKVKLLGLLNYKTVPKILNLAYVLVLPSIKTPEWEEQYGMVLIEAIACKKPFITTNLYLKNLIKGAGIFIPESNPKKLSEAIVDLLTDQKKYKQISRRAGEIAQLKFDSKKQAKEIEKKLINL